MKANDKVAAILVNQCGRKVIELRTSATSCLLEYFDVMNV